MTETNETPSLVERRASGRLSRLWWSIRRPGRIERFNRWRSAPRVTTRGYLIFKDFIVLALCSAIVLAGLSAVHSLRSEDCEAANARRSEVRDVAITQLNNSRRLLANDQFLLDLADSLSTDGLPVRFREPLQRQYDQLRAEFDQLESDIIDAYRPMLCPGRGWFNP
jgi:hypothetical protein